MVLGFFLVSHLTLHRRILVVAGFLAPARNAHGIHGSTALYFVLLTRVYKQRNIT